MNLVLSECYSEIIPILGEMLATIERSQNSMFFDRTTFTDDRDEIATGRRRKIVIFLILLLLGLAVIYGVYLFESLD